MLHIVNNSVMKQLTTNSFLLVLFLLPLLCSGFTSSARNLPSKVEKQIINLEVPDDEDIKVLRRKINGKVPARSRTVFIGAKEIDRITIWELESPSKLMQLWWDADLDPSAVVKKEKIADPFGTVVWPGSILASKELIQHKDQITNSTVLVLGCGTGVEAQAAALLGAKKVIALDISKLTLRLLKFGCEQAGVGDVVEPTLFDLFSDQPLPDCDVMVAADVLYNEELAAQIGKRVTEVLRRNIPPAILVTDSQRFAGTDFLPDVNKNFPDQDPLDWSFFELKNFRGSGVMMDTDQTYDATTRMISINWQ